MAHSLFLCAIFLLFPSCKVDGSKPLMGIRNEGLGIRNEGLGIRNEGSTTLWKAPHPSNLEMVATSPLALERSEEALLYRSAYTLSYNKDTRCPNWVAWHLTAEHVNGVHKRDGLKFMEDEEVTAPRATNMDYVQSGYDRGHMCPSGDNKWSADAQRESFLYTNCCPQLHNLNAGDWNELEQSCRKWAEELGELWIACGPIYIGENHKKIGRNKVVVPEAFFKVILTKADGEYQSIGFIYRNEAANKPKSSYVNTVDQVERITGMDFFHHLPDSIETKVEAVKGSIFGVE